MRVEPSLKVVVDTNVWISGSLLRNSAPALLLHRVLESCVPVFSPQTFRELEERIWKPKFDRYVDMEFRRHILHDLNAAAFWIEIPPEISAMKFCRDQDDDKFIQTALAGEAPLLVTGDRDLLDAPPVDQLQILSPSEALLHPALKK